MCPAATAAVTASGVACAIGLRPTTATGACSQRPTHGAGITRTLAPRPLRNASISRGAPASSHDSDSQTRTVSGGGGVSAFLHHVEVVIERRDFVDFGRGQPHFARERDEMRGGKKTVAVLDFVQVLDQQIAAPRGVAQKRLHLRERLHIDRAPLELAGTAFAAFHRTAFHVLSSGGRTADMLFAALLVFEWLDSAQRRALNRRASTHDGLHQLAHLRRIARDLDAALFHHGELLVRGAFAAGDDRAGVAHALARRRGRRRR